jgi:predicted transcriptional regulator
MEVVYRRGGATAAEVAAHMPDPPSYSAVRAMLSILEGKGHLRHEARGGRYVYLPTVPHGTARKRALRDLVATFFQGSPRDAVISLLDEAGRELSDEDLAAIREQIDGARKQGR